MSLEATQLFAVYGVVKDLGAASSIRSLKVDGQSVPDVSAAVKQAQQLWTATRREIDGTLAGQAPKKGLVGRVADKLNTQVEKFENSDMMKRDGVNRAYHRLTEPLRAEGASVVRRAEVEVELNDGTRYRIPVDVLDLSKTLATRHADLAAITVTATPIPIPIPFVGLIKSVGVPLASALAVAVKRRSAERNGDQAEAKALDSVLAKDRRLAWLGAIPLLHTLPAAYALLQEETMLEQLKQIITIEQLVKLGEKTKLAA